MKTLLKILLSPEPLIRNITRGILLKVPTLQRVLTIDERIAHAVVPRPHYAYCMLHGARLAKRLGFQRTSIIEFGVAGGAGLVTAEALAASIERETGIALDIIGFDMGSGMPVARDYRDMAYYWKPGYFLMHEAVLRARLRRAELVLGPIAKTSRPSSPASVFANHRSARCSLMWTTTRRQWMLSRHSPHPPRRGCPA
jgi:hypothetical protein